MPNVYPLQAKVGAMRIWIVAIALLLLVPAGQAAWPAFHNDQRHTGFQAGTQYTVYKESWWSAKIDPITQVEASPIVSDGYAVFAGWDGIVRVYDAETGTPRWQATMGKIVGTPAIASGTLFVVDTTGALKSFDLDRGTLLYTAAVGTTFSGITLHEGKLFVGNDAGVMHAFYADKLTPLWTFAVNSISDATTTTCSGTPSVCSTVCNAKIPVGAIRGSPVVFDGNVIFGSLNTWVYAVKEQATTTAPVSWIFKTNDAIFGSPAIDSANRRVLIGSFDEKVYALPTAPSGQGEITVGTPPVACTALKNTATWTYAVPSTFGSSKVESTPAIDGLKAYFGANNGRVYAIHLSNGAQAWEFATGAAVVSSPAVSNSIVVAGSDDGKLYWLSANNGTKLKEFQLDSSVKASPALDGDKTYIASYEGAIHMLGPEIPKRPDLRVSAVAYAAGALTFIVENGGTGDAGASKLRVAVDGAFLVDLDVPAIAAGSTATVTHATALTEGAHTINATADYGATVAESQEANNALEQAVTVTAQQADEGDGKKGKGGSAIPGPGVLLLVAALALALAVRRRRA